MTDKSGPGYGHSILDTEFLLKNPDVSPEARPDAIACLALGSIKRYDNGDHGGSLRLLEAALYQCGELEDHSQLPAESVLAIGSHTARMYLIYPSRIEAWWTASGFTDYYHNILRERLPRQEYGTLEILIRRSEESAERSKERSRKVVMAAVDQILSKRIKASNRIE